MPEAAASLRSVKQSEDGDETIREVVDLDL